MSLAGYKSVPSIGKCSGLPPLCGWATGRARSRSLLPSLLRKFFFCIFIQAAEHSWRKEHNQAKRFLCLCLFPGAGGCFAFCFALGLRQLKAAASPGDVHQDIRV